MSTSNQHKLNQAIKIIETSNNVKEVVSASIEAASLLAFDYQYTESILILEDALKHFDNQKEDPQYVEVLNDLITYAIQGQLKKDAYRYLQYKKEALPILSKHLYLIDLINYKKAFNEDYFPLIDELLTLNVDKGVIANLLFERLLHHKDDYEKASIDLELLKKYPNQLDEPLKALTYYIYYHHDKEKLVERLKDDDSIYKQYYQLLSYIDEDNYKQAQLIEVEYENDFINLPYDMQTFLYKRLVELYKDDLRSMELYQKKYDKVTRLMVKEVLPKSKTLKLPKKKVKQEEELKLDIKPKERPNHNEVLFHVDKFMLSVIGLSRNLDFFEYLRQLSIHMEKHFDFSDIIYNFNYEVYHYKKERLYEKQLSNQQLDSTILGICAQEYVDIVSKTDTIKYDYDILSSKPLSQTDIKNVYCYALENKSSICFYQRQDKALMYDDLAFKVLSNVISYEIKTYRQLDHLKNQHKQNLDIFNANLIALSYGSDKISANDAFYNLFAIKKEPSFQEMLLKIDPKDRIKYKELMEALLRKEILEFELNVEVEGKTIHVKHILNTQVYGYYIDMTTYQETKDYLLKQATTTPYNTYTRHGFEVDFNDYITQKTTFLLIELEHLEELSTLYGRDALKDYFTLFQQVLSNYGKVYQFDLQSVILVWPFNDIRTVEKKINTLIDEIKSVEAPYRPFSFSMGVIRYPINTKEKSIDKIYTYLNTALEKGKLSHQRYAHFNYDDYQEMVFETEIIRQIDRLIESETLDITFTQMVNQTTNRVYAYDIGVYSNTLKINPNYYHLIAQKKNKTENLERYILKQTFKALESIYQQTKKYVRLSVNISATTLRSKDFNPFLIGLYKTYNIPYSIVDIIILMKEGNLSDYEKGKELHDVGILIGCDQLTYLKEPQTKVFHYKEKPGDLNEKFLDFIHHLKLYCDNQGIDLVIYHVDRPKDKVLLKAKGFSFIRGDTVDKTFTYEALLGLIKGVLH